MNDLIQPSTHTFDWLHLFGLSVEPNLPAVAGCARSAGAASARTWIAKDTESKREMAHIWRATDLVRTSVHNRLIGFFGLMSKEKK